jgi:hypothetical protein
VRGVRAEETKRAWFGAFFSQVYSVLFADFFKLFGAKTVRSSLLCYLSTVFAARRRCKLIVTRKLCVKIYFVINKVFYPTNEPETAPLITEGMGQCPLKTVSILK